MNSPRKKSVSQSPETFQIRETSSTASRYKRRRKSAWQSPAYIGMLLLLVAIVGAAFFWMNQGEPVPKIAFKQSKPISGSELSELRFQPEFDVENLKKSDVRFSLKGAPAGLILDEKTGAITWTPSETQGPGDYEFTLNAHDRGGKKRLAYTKVSMTVAEVVTPPVWEPVAVQQVTAGEMLVLPLSVTDADLPVGNIQWELASDNTNQTATLRETSGLMNTLEWQTEKTLEPGEYRFRIIVSKPAHESARVTETVAVQVLRGLSPFQKIGEELAKTGVRVENVGANALAKFSTNAELLTLNNEDVELYHYDSEFQLNRDLNSIDNDASTIAGKKMAWTAPPHFFRNQEFIALYEGDDERVLAGLQAHFGKPFVVGSVMSEPEPMPIAEKPSELEATLVTLYDSKKLYQATQYETLRKLFAEEFEKRHEAEIKRALADDYEPMMAWFKENNVLQEEFYLAIDPQADDIYETLRLFNELRKAHPDELSEYGNLAIALAVTWDKPRGSVYDYEGHQRRTKTTMPAGLIDASGNFEYFLAAKRVMQGRAQFLPWEFQLYMINHKTPSLERQWAVANYLPKRSMIGKCYSEVPYDMLMLNTQSRECKLMGKEYSLPNILNFGGVCAMQADFAARVGKSLGVPTEYVNGESRFGDHHAWVMWVELLSVTKQGIRFSLQSHGRYGTDNYYVGNLRNPQTGARMTDRELELYLHTVGSDPIANRQSNLVMKALPIIEKQKAFNLEDRLDYLKKVIALNPGNQQAWREIAALTSSPELERKHRKQFSAILTQFFNTFANFPDFTWEIFDQLIAYETELKSKTKLYERLVALYEAAGRPDLSSKARLKLTEYLVDADELKAATQGLGITIIKFADEGRFVVTMLDKLEEIAKNLEGSEKELAAFYLAFLQKIPRTRGGSPSKYCIEMYKRGITRMQQLNQLAIAQQLQIELTKLEAGQ